MTIEQIIAEEMTPHTINFWGDDYENFTPVLAKKRHSDGLRLMWFTPLNTRPNYYLIRVDSALPINDDDEVREFVEDRLIPALEDEFGTCDDEEDCEAWPMLDLGCGYSWGFFDENGEDV